MGFVQAPKLIDGVIFFKSAAADADGVICLSGVDGFLLDPVSHEKLIPLLTGEHRLQDLATLLKGEMDATAIVATVQLMAKHGAVIDAAASAGGVGHAVSVRATAEADASGVKAALSRAGIATTEADDAAALRVIVTDHYLRDELGDLTRGSSTPILIVRPDARNPWVGPLIVPGETACWECLAQRLRLNFRAESFAMAETGALPVPKLGHCVSETGQGVAHAVIVQFVRDWLGNGSRLLANALLVVNPETLAIDRHPIVRRPQCPACGSAQTESVSFPQLHDRRLDAGARDTAAQRTLERFDYHLSPITGLVDDLSSRSRSPGVHVYSGGRYVARPAANWRGLMRSLQFRAAGKGLTDAAAKAGALAETLEWYTLGAQDPNSLVRDTYGHLQSHARAIPPPAIAHFSDAQYADREALNRRYDETKYNIPERFDPEADIDWQKAWSLTREEWAYVPAAACSISFANRFMNPSSNGSAAGATLEDAIVHGAMEAIERDAVALWWYNMARRPQVDLEGVDAALLRAMREHYDRIGYRFWLLDITTDLGVPTMAAVSIALGQTHGRPTIGFGTHWEPRVAAARALTELNQLHPRLVDVVVREGRDRVDQDLDLPLPPQIFPRDDAALLRLDRWELPDREPGTGDIALLVERFRRGGLEMLVADLTLPDVGLPVAKVLVPGLRQPHPEFGPGRLHDVPLALEWIDRPVPETVMRTLRAAM